MRDDVLESFFSAPRESLTIELKNWLDPLEEKHCVKLIKAFFALRNFNGGYLILGFDDKTARPEPPPSGWDIDSRYAFDGMQQLISRHASEKFEIEQTYGVLDDIRFPIFRVPSGVRKPVAINKPLGEKLKQHEIYIRTLESNGAPSSAIAGYADLDVMLTICFENRERDIAGFLRRQLTADMSAELALAAIREALGSRHETGSAVVPDKASRAAAERLAIEGHAVFSNGMEGVVHPSTKEVLQRPSTVSASIVVLPEKPDERATAAFKDVVLSANPNLTGWPPWPDLRNAPRKDLRPWIQNNRVTSLVKLSDGRASHFEYWTIDPRGRFFLARVLPDDLRRDEGEMLDPVLQIYRTAEILAVALTMTRQLGWDELARMTVRFEWTALSGRHLESWAEPARLVRGTHVCRSDTVITYATMTVGTPIDAIANVVRQIVSPLFIEFDGFDIPATVYEDIVETLLSRRVGRVSMPAPEGPPKPFRLNL